MDDPKNIFTIGQTVMAHVMESSEEKLTLSLKPSVCSSSIISTKFLQSYFQEEEIIATSTPGTYFIFHISCSQLLLVSLCYNVVSAALKSAFITISFTEGAPPKPNTNWSVFQIGSCVEGTVKIVKDFGTVIGFANTTVTGFVIKDHFPVILCHCSLLR